MSVESELVTVTSNGKAARVARYRLVEPVKPEQTSLGLVA